MGYDISSLQRQCPVDVPGTPVCQNSKVIPIGLTAAIPAELPRLVDADIP